MKWTCIRYALVIALSCLGGCATTDPDKPRAMSSIKGMETISVRQYMGTLAIVGSPDSTESEVKGVLVGKAEGAVAGGVSYGLYMCLMVPVPPLCLPFGAIAAASAAASAPSREEFEQLQNVIQEAVLAMDPQQDLIDELRLQAEQFYLHPIALPDKYEGLIRSRGIETEEGRKTMQDYTGLAAGNIDMLLEVGPSRIILEPGDKHEQGLHLALWTQASMLSTASAEVLQTREFYLPGSVYAPMGKWGEWNAKSVRDQLKKILSYASGYIAEQMLGQEAPRLLSPSMGSTLVLRWQPVSTGQLGIDPHSLSYEIFLVSEARLKEVGCGIHCLLAFSGPSFYRREGIRGESHQVEMNVKDCDSSYWSVRAVFRVDGAVKKSKWAEPKRISTTEDEFDSF